MPTVSIIIPCYNEQSTIQLLLNALYSQTVSHRDMEVIVADGMSTDDTRDEVARFQQTHPKLQVRIVDNPRQNIPSGLNRALSTARGEFIVRLDAHSVPSSDYVSRCMDALQRGQGENVGGVWQIVPGGEGWLAYAIAVAAAHPLGVGDARYRYTQQAQHVDTVPFGAFRKKLFDQIGMFDETLLTNEDYEFNVRIRGSGGRVWLDPTIRSTYFARPTLVALARQYARYGFWKARMLRQYPNAIRWRQALPPCFVATIIGLALLSFWLSLARGLLVLEIGLYTIILLVVGIQTAVQKRDLALIIGVPLAIATMHLSWGAALLWSLVCSLVDRKS